MSPRAIVAVLLLGLHYAAVHAGDTPQPVTGLSGRLAAIAAGASHTCALTTSGAVQCWGDNRHGQLGNGSHQSTTAPQTVAGLGSGVAAITAGDSHSCALTTAGGVLCWGANRHGQLGTGSQTDSNRPQPVAGLVTGVAVISAGRFHTCAITMDGMAHCWGRNESGQLGLGVRSSNANTPQAIASSAQTRHVLINAGLHHTCAVAADGSAECWGTAR